MRHARILESWGAQSSMTSTQNEREFWRPGRGPPLLFGGAAGLGRELLSSLGSRSLPGEDGLASRRVAPLPRGVGCPCPFFPCLWSPLESSFLHAWVKENTLKNQLGELVASKPSFYYVLSAFVE